jgi:L-ascorbate metabolism protein UlaG (beta-lactamase superfamily)
VALTVTAYAVDGSAVFGAKATGARRERMERSPQWKDGRFRNPQPIRNDLWRVLRDLAGASAHRRPEEPVPTEPVDPARFDAPPDSGLRTTWLGHSTVLVELDRHRVLVDPVWGDRASPFGWAGPRRFFAPLLPLDRVPRVDAVVISHDHFDHLDLPTIRAIRGWDTTFVVPLGVGAHLERWGVPPERIVELDWWEATRVGDLEVVATPARHASGRSPFSGRDGTLWAGFALVGQRHRVWYSGDTGPFPGLAEIGARLGPFDLALVEAGAYGRAWPDWHLGPEQAVRASQLVRARVLQPVHWALFNLAYHGWTEPAERVRVAAREAGVTVTIPRPGQSVEPAALPALERWWPTAPWRSAEEDPIEASGVDARPGDVARAAP